MDITVFVLKLLALCSMLIDHAGFFLYPRFASRSFTRILRTVGRLAFPVYAFLIVNGYDKTRDVRRYLTRLSAFALISQLPYVLMVNWKPAAAQGLQLAFSGFWPLQLALIALVAWVWLTTVRRDRSVFWPVLALLAGVLRVSAAGVTLLSEDLNVFYTLALGLACVSILDRAQKPDRELRPLLLQSAAVAAVFFLIRGTADYRYLGVALIVSLGLTRGRRSSQAILLVMWCAVEYLLAGMPAAYFLSAALSAVLALLYKGRQGPPVKSFFYWAYPCHLLILGLVNIALRFRA